MVTAQVIARRALKRILVEADEAPLEDTEYADFYDIMNDFMADLEAKNINLGYTPVSLGTDIVTVPDGALRGIITNCAIEAAADYGGSISESLRIAASEGMKTLRKLGKQRIKRRYPSDLHRGSGNSGYTYDHDFYYGQYGALISLSGNTSETVISATDAPVSIIGSWRVERSKALLGRMDGTIENTSGNEIDASVSLTLSCTGNSTYTFWLLRNGVHIERAVSAALTSTPASVDLSDVVTLYPGDFLSIEVEDDLATENVTVIDGQFEVG